MQELILDAQKLGGTLPIVVDTGPDSQFPELITSDNFPLFPFTDQFNTGYEVNPGNKISLAGDLNIPVPGWGNWDMDLNFYTGNINTDAKVGYQVSPTNPLGIKPETLALLHQNPAFRKARKKARVVSLGRFPYGYEPSRCKPPYCNPFVHHTAVGVEVEPGDDSFFIGGVDFPLALGTHGMGVRFPLSGAVEQGTSPLAYAHGHAFNPSSAFDMTKIDGVRRRKPQKLSSSANVKLDSFSNFNANTFSTTQRKRARPAALFNSDIKQRKKSKLKIKSFDDETDPLASSNIKFGNSQPPMGDQNSEKENVKGHKKFVQMDKDFIGYHEDGEENSKSGDENKKKDSTKNVDKYDPLAASSIKFDIFT